MYTNEKTIITVDIDDFKKYKEETRGEYVDYVDDNVIVARNMEKLPYSNRMIRLNLFIIVACIEGKMQLNINKKDYQLQAGEAFVCLPTMIISNMLLSPQHKVSLIGFSTKFLQIIYDHRHQLYHLVWIIFFKSRSCGYTFSIPQFTIFVIQNKIS